VCDDPQTDLFFFWKKSENHHVRFNIDVKVQNDPERLFKRLNDVITSQPNWERVFGTAYSAWSLASQIHRTSQAVLAVLSEIVYWV